MVGYIALGRGILVSALLLLAACETRSISNAGYKSNNPFYKGELSEYDVLGVDRSSGFSDSDIQKALLERRPIAVKKGSAVMLVQSGALLADPDMVSAMEKYFTVSSFSGVPLSETARSISASPPPTIPYSQLFRMAAAKGGYETVVVYWGMLESASEGLGGKAISWLPIIGGVVPDETQHMRIRLMVAVIDVRTGQWDSFSVEPAEDEAISNQHGRAAVDQRQVALLKTKAYKAAAEAIALRYAR
jgi:hypothetical protein